MSETQLFVVLVFFPVTQKSFWWLWITRSHSFAALLGFETGNPSVMDKSGNLVSHQSTLESWFASISEEAEICLPFHKTILTCFCSLGGTNA